jgi:large subunit ribosomal protein L21
MIRFERSPAWRRLPPAARGEGVIMYAVVEFLGKQYKVEKGRTVKVSHIDAEPGAQVKIDRVLLVAGETIAVGKPYVEGASVSVTVASHGKDRKIIVFKYKPKKDYRRKKGHRQGYSVIKIDDIETA